LANGEESLNKTFSEFKELQKKWTEIGPVPSASSNTLWNNYQLQIERFYDFIKINKELRDLDLKKNLEMKLELCEKTEDLLLESDVRKAYKILQEYHESWKEVGPVDLDKKEEIWNRFSEATKKIRKSYQDYFINIRKEHENNYKQKQALCEKVEEINNLDTPKNRKQWVDTSKEILELQKVWKTIGMVPKEVNEEIYQRFRSACNRFFEEKKEFFNVINEELNKNLQQKIDICVQAESAKDNQDWKKTAELFFDLQKKWKAIGTVPGKQSDIVWKRFRKACDHFFNAKESFFGDLVKEQDDNAKKKEELIEKINNFEPLEAQTENIKKIKELQNEWIKIGMVPRKLKDKLQDSYRDSISKLYDKLNLSKKHIDSQNYKTRIEVYKTTEDSKQLNIEKSKIQTKIKAIEDDIRLWENNMNFFSGGAKSLVSDFNDKISKAKEEITVLKNRIKMIDLAEREIEQNQKGEKNE